MKKDKKKKEKGKKDKKDKDVDKDKRKDTTIKDTEQGMSKVPENVTLSNESPQKITKKINDLIITVPQQTSRKIKLNRNKVTVSVNNENNPESNRVLKVTESNENSKGGASNINTTIIVVDKSNAKDGIKDKIGEKNDKKDRTRKKKRKKRVSADKDSDHDEITLQLSDSEKMDLLEDFDRKTYAVVCSSSSEDTDSSSDSESDSNNSKNTSKDSSKDTTVHDKNTAMEIKDPIKVIELDNKFSTNEDSVKDTCLEDPEENNKTDSVNTIVDSDKSGMMTETGINKTIDVDITDSSKQYESPERRTEITGFISDTVTKNVLIIQNIDDIPVMTKELETDSQDRMEKQPEIITSKVAQTNLVEIDTDNKVQNDIVGIKHIEVQKPETQEAGKDLSEGELSERDSSEIEALDLKPEVVCISDDEKGSAKKKKKKDKKKKEKKSKKKDFQECADETFYKKSDYLDKQNTENSIKMADNSIEVTEMEPHNIKIENTQSISVIDDDVYEIFELSDDSSCYEVEGTVLSKEPTVEEIAALSAKIDELEKEERDDVITEAELKEFVKEHDNLEANDNIENISWKDRYLDSKKVKKVLSTSNILNALRKKNKELKCKLEEKKKLEEELKQKEKENEANKVQEDEAKEELVEEVLEEGSIEHYNTLQGSTKYVDPVKEIDKTEEANEGDKKAEGNNEKGVTGEMKKDAKQLLKMYKKLIKYNDMNKQKQKDPNKKKKKKSKKKETSKEGVSVKSTSMEGSSV